MKSQHYSVIVIGGGHAGTEAALAPATFRSIQCAELNTCFVNRMRHSATHRINLFHQMPLGSLIMKAVVLVMRHLMHCLGDFVPMIWVLVD
jgi:NADH dehydrogenase FAD-containing subunit